ncbi:hypothetical protein ICC18_31095 [Paenibacillus sp. WST5]|uniref:Uncharacterized protein n=1 Tax=Paenibacillus sedimenti TaxID=2770274 RepID=A0A926QM15_9BACL|nr:hypothetical protein [Paenibacillus sedimenti]
MAVERLVLFCSADLLVHDHIGFVVESVGYVELPVLDQAGRCPYCHFGSILRRTNFLSV